jgi:flavorubredoxin
MDVAIVYETLFGTTRSVADALAAGVQDADPQARVTVLPVDDVPSERIASAGLLLVGGPTHAFGMSRAATRRSGRQQDAAAAEAAHASATGVREWLDALPPAPAGALAAAFTTRVSNPLGGSAAKGIAKRLRKAGYELAAEPEGFVVTGTEGPLEDGELDRARRWAADLVGRLVPPRTG